jgi:hypothetical protein
MSSQWIYSLIFVALGYAVSAYVGRQFAKISLPLALGVLVTGLALSPYALGRMIPTYYSFSMAAIRTILYQAIQYAGLLGIGVLLGFSLKGGVMKVIGKKLLVLALIDIVGGVAFVALPLVLFIGLDPYVSLLIGILSVAIMPAIAISILSENKSEGIIALVSLPTATLNAILSIVGIFGIIFLTLGHFGVQTVPEYYLLLMCLLSALVGKVLAVLYQILALRTASKGKRQILFVLLDLVFTAFLIRFNAFFNYTLLMPLIIGLVFGVNLINVGKSSMILAKDLKGLIIHFVIINVFTVGRISILACSVNSEVPYCWLPASTCLEELPASW